MSDHGFAKKRDNKGDTGGFIGLKVKELPVEILNVHIEHKGKDGLTVRKAFSDLKPVWLSTDEIISMHRINDKIWAITIPGLLARMRRIPMRGSNCFR
jgi:hypothetical protein